MAFWLSSLYECSVCLIEMEERVGIHCTTRNTGVIHRPFYLDPDRKRVFARSAQKSYFLWRRLASRFSSPWDPVGTLEVATTEEDVKVLGRYLKWALANGVADEEVELLDGAGVKNLEPDVACPGAIHSKTDTGVFFGELTAHLFSLAEKNGVRLLSGSRVTAVEEDADGTSIQLVDAGGSRSKVMANLAVNAAGGASLDIAHMLSLAEGYADLHFRGEYWQVQLPFSRKIRRNVYSIPRVKEFPFLDPHFIVRADGRREIGPNAVLVAGPYAYRGFATSVGEIASKVAERPMSPMIRLFANPKFLSLVASEWRSSISKRAMCARVARFIPSMDPSLLEARGVAGVRSSLLDAEGFVPEAVEVRGVHSLHILNYNSPGATGAPAFSAREVARLREWGQLDYVERPVQRHSELWPYDWSSDFQALEPLN